MGSRVGVPVILNKWGIRFAPPGNTLFFCYQWVMSKNQQVAVLTCTNAFHSCFVGVWQFFEATEVEQSGYPTFCVFANVAQTKSVKKCQFSTSITYDYTVLHTLINKGHETV